MQLAVSGYELQVDDEHLGRLSDSTGATPDIRSLWTATTADYTPIVLVELAAGLVIAGGSAAAGEQTRRVSVGLRWDEIVAVTQDEHDWRLEITSGGGVVLQLLFASVGELHLVSNRIADRWSAAHAERSAAAEGDDSGAVGERAESPASRCAQPTGVRSGSRPRTHARRPQAHDPALDRIERRLASVETLLAVLAGETHAGGA